MKRIALVNPFVPHYREEFYLRLGERYDLDIYVYDSNKSDSDAFNLRSFPVKQLKAGSFLKKRFVAYDPRPFLSPKYDAIVLMLNFGHLSTWLLLLLNLFSKKRVILWGQGISVKRYTAEMAKPSLLLRLMIQMSDGVWIYTEPEARMWRKRFPGKPIVAVNNTISGVADILHYESGLSKQTLKKQFGINEEICFIFCARFNNPFRRIDLLLEAIARLDSSTYGFIIIGAGGLKPDFSNFHNVHDFGAVYDENLKAQLFALADIYFQPGWIGLSVVEAMAYGKPILTFRRSQNTFQCVEYHYIADGVNGYLLDDIDDFLKRVYHTPQERWIAMGNASKRRVSENLLMEHMVSRAAQVLDNLAGSRPIED